MTRIDAASSFVNGPTTQVYGALEVPRWQGAPPSLVESMRPDPSVLGQTEEHLAQSPAIHPKPNLKPATIDHLFGHQSEGEIALSAALLVVRLEENSFANAPEDVLRGHAALEEMAQMFEHLSMMRSSPTPEVPK